MSNSGGCIVAETKPIATKQFSVPKVLCPTCDQRVYPMEAIRFGEKTYHKGCFKCTHCSKSLTLSNVGVSCDKLFCKPHFKELMKKGGGRYSFGSKLDD